MFDCPGISTLQIAHNLKEQKPNKNKRKLDPEVKKRLCTYVLLFELSCCLLILSLEFIGSILSLDTFVYAYL